MGYPHPTGPQTVPSSNRTLTQLPAHPPTTMNRQIEDLIVTMLSKGQPDKKAASTLVREAIYLTEAICQPTNQAVAEAIAQTADSVIWRFMHELLLTQNVINNLGGDKQN